MARQRFIKPSFFLHGELFDAEAASRLPLRVAFAGLWTQADRRGVFRCKPRELKAAILPHDPCDMEAVLDALESGGFIQTYVVDGKRYGFIPTLPTHQTFHRDEKPSNDPGPVLAQGQHGVNTVPAPCSTEVVGTDGLGNQHRASTVPAQGQHADPTLPYPTTITTAVADVAAVQRGDTTWTPAQREAADGWRRALPDPRAFDAIVAQAAEERLVGGGFGWPVVGQALLEMRGASGVTFGLACLLGFCRRIRDRGPTAEPVTNVADEFGRMRPARRDGAVWRFTDALGGSVAVAS